LGKEISFTTEAQRTTEDHREEENRSFNAEFAETAQRPQRRTDEKEGKKAALLSSFFLSCLCALCATSASLR